MDALRYGSKEDVGRAVTELSRLKDPSYKEALKDVTNSSDPFLSVMAAYALGESGDSSGMQFLEEILQASFPFLSLAGMEDMNRVREVLSQAASTDRIFALHNSSYYLESKEKLLKLLELYAAGPPRMDLGYFDELVSFSVRKTKGLILNALSTCELGLGNMEEALKLLLEAVGLAEETQDPQLLKLTYADLGHLHISMGNYFSALELLETSLEIDEQSHDPWRKRNRTVSNLARLYYQLGRYDKALEYGQEALELSEKEKDLKGSAHCLNLLGVMLSNLQELEEAAGLLQRALGLSAEELHNPALQALILNNLAYIYFSKGEGEKAKATLFEALALALKMSDKSAEATIRSGLAFIEREEGDTEEAESQAKTALELFRGIFSPVGQSEVLFLLGSMEDFIYDNPLAAYEHYREAISLCETQRENLGLEDFKLSFAGTQAEVYQQMVALCMRMDRTTEAFEYIERSKSRAFVDMLASLTDTVEAKELRSEQLEEIAALKGRMSLLRRQLAAAWPEIKKDAPDIRQEDIRQEELRTELRSLEKTYLLTFEELKRKDPEWASLVSVAVADLAAVRDKLDKETALIELYQTAAGLHLIVIRKNSRPVSLRLSIDVEAEAERLFSLITALSGGVQDTRSHTYIKEVRKPLAYFYELIIRPVYELIRDASHLVLVPHLFWHYLPFHALLDSGSRESLIDKFSISYAPSATALNLVCGGDKRSYNSALILANPTGDLPYAEEEARVIQDRFSGRAKTFIGKQATLDRLRDSSADIIHLACHGYFRGDEPVFSYLVLGDAEGKPSPFFLPDVFNLKLKASLVTLSACETGLSRFNAGDELTGLARAFFYAGASSLLTSMWTINDKATSIFMNRFYEEIVSKGRNKAEALRLAILELKARPEYNHPYFWAPFFLTGAWR